MAIEQISRLEALLPPNVYSRLKRAALLKGLSLTGFIDHAAQRAIEEERLMHLTAQDQKLFIKAINHPPNPTAVLRKAKRLHQKYVDAR